MSSVQTAKSVAKPKWQFSNQAMLGWPAWLFMFSSPSVAANSSPSAAAAAKTTSTGVNHAKQSLVLNEQADRNKNLVLFSNQNWLQ